MLINIIKMPPVFGIPMDRGLSICTDLSDSTQAVEPVAYWPSIPLTHPNIMAGAVIDRTPQNVYKATHVSFDGQWVFESVFALENLSCVCLYSKIISSADIRLGISLNAIVKYSGTKPFLRPMTHFVGDMMQTPDNHLETPPFMGRNAVDNIVPPVFGDRALWQYIHRLLDAKMWGHADGRLGWIYKPLYDHVPSVMEALIEGAFRRNPFEELRERHPMVNFVPEKWFGYEELAYGVRARGCESYVNHPAFDGVALSIMGLSATRLVVTSLMSHAIDGISDLWLTREYQDVYNGILRGMTSTIEKYKQDLSNIFYVCAQIYCRLYNIDHEEYMYKMEDQSSITISKTMTDEITITFHDTLYGRYIGFYHSFPALALSTLAVAHVV